MESEFLSKLKPQERYIRKQIAILSSLLSTSDKNSTGCDALTTTLAPHCATCIKLHTLAEAVLSAALGGAFCSSAIASQPKRALSITLIRFGLFSEL